MLERNVRDLLLVTSLVMFVGSSLSVGTARSQVLDFDAIAAGSVVTVVPPATFHHPTPGIDLVASTGLPSTSMSNYLGAAYLLGPSNDEQDLFLPGEVLDIGLDAPVTSISLAVISTPGTPAGAFELVTSQGSVTSGAIPDQFAGYDEVFFLSFSSPAPFSSVTLRSAYQDGLFAYHVDDIVVPEPGVVPLVAMGSGLLVLFARIRNLPSARRLRPSGT